jgi:hypothetical protein
MYDPGFESRHVRERGFSPDRLWGFNQPPIQLVPRFSLPGRRGGVKRPRREFSHSPPSNADVKNGWSYTPVSPVCLRGVKSENFTFAVYVVACCFFSHSRKHSAENLLLEHERWVFMLSYFRIFVIFILFQFTLNSFRQRWLCFLGTGSSKDSSPFSICFAVWCTSRRLMDHCPLSSGCCTHYVTCVVRGMMPGLLAGKRTYILISIQQ